MVYGVNGMKKYWSTFCDDLALFGLSCSLALTTWVGIMLFGFYAFAMIYREEKLVGGIMAVCWVLLVWRKAHVRVEAVTKSVKSDDDDQVSHLQ